MIAPMLASLADAPLNDPQLVYEPKYDGIRAIVEIAPGGRTRLWSRLGNEKTRRFPEIVAALEKLFGRTGSPMLRLSDQVRGDGNALYQQALERGWEGLIAKHASSLYKPGKRSPDWRKLKLVHEQEFVIGGWTEPRQTRAYSGALVLGVYESEGPGPHRPGDA